MDRSLAVWSSVKMSALLENSRRVLLRSWWFMLAYFIAVYYVIQQRIGKRIGSYRGLRDKELCRRDGDVAIVTGGSRGIGLEIVHCLLEYGHSVIIGSSSPEETRSLLERSLKEKYPHASVEVWHLDLASLKSVKAFAERFLSSGMQLNLLINNAGIMFVPFEETDDGLERHFAVNYLSHFLLTLLLLPVLERSGKTDKKSRIINSTSCIHYVGSLNLKDLQGRLNYSKYYAYMQSKLAQVMFTYSLQSLFTSKCSNVVVNCCHPGVVNTDLMNCVWWTSYVGSVFFKTAKEGSETVIYTALSKDMEGVGGKYLEECRTVESSRVSKDSSSQKTLWNMSLKYLQPWLPHDQYMEMVSFRL